MMIYPYNEYYLSDAMNNLGEAFDYAVNMCQIDIEYFMQLFISTGFAKRFENGNPKIVSGLSGVELAIEILSKVNLLDIFPKTNDDYQKSAEYWCGYILAYYQWKTSRSFKDINFYIPMIEIIKLYPTLHEADDEKSVDVFNSIINSRKSNTKLQIQRKICGLTQKELALNANVNLRTLQQYETRAKDLNQASVSTVISLSKVLGCNIEDLIEL